MRILVAEDDNALRLVLTAKLKKMGYEVIVAEDGEYAWQAYRMYYPQLVLTDWMMPKVHGLELCRLIRGYHLEKYTYIIMLTSLSGKKNYLEGMNAGADDFLNKPVDMDELTARLHVAERILNLHTTVRQLEGLLPICAYCKNIRDEKNEWHPIEAYISRRSDASFSHGCCPKCVELFLKPQLEEIQRAKAQV